MNANHMGRTLGRSCCRRGRGFTLIELLTVIAIIALLMSILLPALSTARTQAKRSKTAAALKALGDGLEMFQGDNPTEFRGYPPSAFADDPTEEGKENWITGAQWLVRYLMGKDLKGYVPRRNVPLEMRDNATAGWEQKNWYANGNTGETYDNYLPLPRVGPYVTPERVTLARPRDLMGYDGANLPTHVDNKSTEQMVILDPFGFPILYYAANPFVAGLRNCWLAMPEPNTQGSQTVYAPGIYTFIDNAWFTGFCMGGSCRIPSWNFGGGDRHMIEEFGPVGSNGEPPSWDAIKTDSNAPNTFSYYILNKNAYDSTPNDNRKTNIPYRKDTFILISAGPDGVYGTGDDVNNF